MKQYTTKAQLITEAKRILTLNDLGDSTRPTATLYPHQWLWDSCFISIGLRHLDLPRAQAEIRSLFRGQWKNGMIPYIIFSESKSYHAGPELWRSHVSPLAPDNKQTSGGTQPPMVAEAVVRIGELLPAAERRAWYKEIYPGLSRYHEWLYRERDPEDTGLVTLIHSWESGMDNTPPWMEMLHKYAISRRLRLLDKSKRLKRFIERFRKDTSVVPASERMSTVDLLAFYDIVRQWRKIKYDNTVAFKKQKLLISDLTLNAILIRANDLLAEIAKEIGEKLPPKVAQARERGVEPLMKLWDEESSAFYCLDYKSGKLIKELTIATFLPLYSGKLPAKRAKALIRHMHDPATFGTKFGLPTTPVNSSYFKPHCYWQGPIWVQVNWLIIDGLKRNGYAAEAEALAKTTLELVKTEGMHEYYSPLDGKHAGAPNFSWTAALTVDLLTQKH
jgi:glycogen debranching enzyme